MTDYPPHPTPTPPCPAAPAGLFAAPDLLLAAYGEVPLVGGPRLGGLVMTGSGRLLAANLLGGLTIAGWTLAHMLPFFLLLNKARLMRVAPEVGVRLLFCVEGSPPARVMHGKLAMVAAAGMQGWRLLACKGGGCWHARSMAVLLASAAG